MQIATTSKDDDEYREEEEEEEEENNRIEDDEEGRPESTGGRYRLTIHRTTNPPPKSRLLQSNSRRGSQTPTPTSKFYVRSIGLDFMHRDQLTNWAAKGNKKGSPQVFAIKTSLFVPFQKGN